MANILSFEVDGVSYSYDTEARNPLAKIAIAKAAEGKLVYDANSKAPTEIVGIPANKLKVVAEDEEPVEDPVVATNKTKTVYFDYGSGDIFVVNLTYTGDINADNASNLRLNYKYSGGSTGYVSGAELQMGSGDSETYPAITPDEGEEAPTIINFTVVSAPSYAETEGYSYTSVTYEED
jgi:hypothetical protein